MHIATIGTGYVGLVTGACLAELGHHVVCVDQDVAKIEGLTRGVMPIYEPGLEELVLANVAAGRLSFSLDLPASVGGADAVFIAVGTPPAPVSGRADLTHVELAAADIGRALHGFTVVVTKSTVPVGTNRRVQEILDATVGGEAIGVVASNPEFLREGAAIEDFMAPDRIVIGADDPRAAAVMRTIYAPLIKRGHNFMATEIETAELIKYAANAFLAVKISYINEISDLCEAVGADVDQVAAGIGMDRRIGAGFLKPGPGWGGSCFPKDVSALHSTAVDQHVPLRIVEAAMEANAHRQNAMLAKITEACGGDLAGREVAVLGLTFKAQTDDLRESPSLKLVRELMELGAKVRGYDPSGAHGARRLAPGLKLVGSAMKAALDADVLVIATEWSDFLSCDLAGLARVMRRPAMVDLRNLFDENHVRKSGFASYLRLGRRRRGEPAMSTPAKAAPNPKHSQPASYVGTL